MKSAVQTLSLLLLVTLAPAQEAVQKLSPLVVEADADSVIPSHVSGSATVIEEAAIADSGARSLAELLASRAGVRITSTSGNSSDGVVHLRGFGDNSASRVLILIDGRAVNRPDMEGVSLLGLPLSRIAKVEVLRGSQTARFGDNAVGGVINIVTKSAGLPRTSLEIAGGSESYALLRLAHDGSYAGHGLAFDLERNETQGWRENSASELESAGLRWQRTLAQGTGLKAGIAWSDEFAEFPGPLASEQYEQDPQQSIYAEYGHQYFSEQTTWKADAALDLEINSDLSCKVPLSFVSANQAWNFGPGSHVDRLLETVTFSPVLRRSWKRGSAELGLDFRHDGLALDRYAEISREHLIGDASLERDVAGIFATAQCEPWADWHVNAAVRWTYSQLDASSASKLFPADPSVNFARGNDDTNEAFQIGLRWEPRKDLAVWLRADQLYRLPSTDEIASYQGFPLSVPFNDQLVAETGQNLELGIEYSLREWSLSANGFLQGLDGEILYDYHQNLNVNFANTRRFGAELDAGYKAAAWEASLHYAALQAEFSDGPYAGKDVCLVPNHELSAILALHPCTKVTLQGEYQFVGSSYEGNDFLNQADKLPAYSVASLLARYEPKPGLSLYVRINNLLDAHYATLKYSGVWYPAAGRTFQCGARCEF